MIVALIALWLVTLAAFLWALHALQQASQDVKKLHDLLTLEQAEHALAAQLLDAVMRAAQGESVSDFELSEPEVRAVADLKAMHDYWQWQRTIQPGIFMIGLN